MNSTATPLRVGIVGLGWMGAVHARAYLRLRHHYLDAPLRPVLTAVADTAEDDRLASAVDAFGFGSLHTDWRDLVDRDDVDVVSVTGPNWLHRDVAVAAARAGKHVWVEKPAGRDVTETEQIRDAVRAAGVQSAVGFNYRNAPAVEVARDLVAEGRLGRVTSVGIRMLADYAAHPDGALSWRFRSAEAGSGVLGDLVSHGVDLARHIVGEIEALVADTAIEVPERPRADPSASHFSRGAGGPLGPVENEDSAAALLRFAGGARGTLVASRTAVGEQCTYGIEVRGDRGALAWDFRRMGELRVCLDQDYAEASWSTRYATPADGELGRFQPGSGIAMGYDDLKVIEAERLVRSIATGVPVGATIEDALAAARLVAAIQASVDSGGWARP